MHSITLPWLTLRSWRRAPALALALIVGYFLPAPAHALPPIFAGDEQSFYQLPAGTPTGDPGTVVRWQRYKPSAGLTLNSDGVIAYRMLYVSTGALGQRTLVSGSVLVPVRVYAPSRPILGFGTGTQGMADSCAASHGIQASSNYDIVYMRQTLDLGWTVAVSDYQGQGTKTDQNLGGRADEHTYVVGTVLGKNVLDSVRAARQFNSQFDSDRQREYAIKFAISGNMSLSSKVVLWGYSEGGNSAAWAGELQPTYAPELKLVALAAGGIPADIAAVGTAINNRSSLQNVAFGVLIAAGIGYKAAYPELVLESRLTSAGLTLLANVKSQCLVDILLHNFGGHIIQDYTVGGFNMLQDGAWLARFEQNKLGAQPPKVPVFLYHAAADEGVEYNQGRQLARTYCAKGVRVNWNPYVGEHATGFVQGMGAAIDFLNNRLNGIPTNAIACNAIF